VYGDDCVVAYNGMRMGMDFAQTIKDTFGMTVTPASKLGDHFNVELHEVEFLKRRFLPFKTEEGFKVAILALNENVIIQHLMWMRNLTTLPQQIQSLMMEYAAYGEEKYNKLRDTMKKRLAKQNLQITVPRYDISWTMLNSVVIGDE